MGFGCLRGPSFAEWGRSGLSWGVRRGDQTLRTSSVPNRNDTTKRSDALSVWGRRILLLPLEPTPLANVDVFKKNSGPLADPNPAPPSTAQNGPVRPPNADASMLRDQVGPTPGPWVRTHHPLTLGRGLSPPKLTPRHRGSAILCSLGRFFAPSGPKNGLGFPVHMRPKLSPTHKKMENRFFFNYVGSYDDAMKHETSNLKKSIFTLTC